MIEITNVSKTYMVEKKALTVLKDINLKVSENEILGIVGLSGAGKSTLIRMMNGLCKPTTGQVLIHGKAINDLRKKDLNRIRYSIGMVFQHFNLLASMTVYDNIKLSLNISKYKKEDIDRRIQEVLTLVGLHHKIKSYPKELSGGERQRVAIARALANHPKVLLCDEATSSLDKVTANELVKLLKKIQEKTNITIVFITHQIEVAKDLCERIIVMQAGEIIENQLTKDLFVHPKMDLTKQLVESIVHDIDFSQEGVYELIYGNRNSKDTTISDTIKKYDIDINILHGKNIDIGTDNIGYLYVQIFGKQKESAIEYLKSQGIEVKVYV